MEVAVYPPATDVWKGQENEWLDLKKKCWRSSESVEDVFNRLEKSLNQEVEVIKKMGSGYIPQVKLSDIQNNEVPKEILAQIKKCGIVIIKGTVPKEDSERWANMAKEYVERNNYFENKVEAKDDKFWPTYVPESKQTTFIFQLYWSIAQIEARQHPGMSVARSFLNRIWSYISENGQYAFDPDKETAYADRMRIRAPGKAIGLRPHVDGGSVERWKDRDFVEFYSKIYEGKWEEYDPWNGVQRVKVNQEDSPNTCTVFRSYQGWLALSAQGAHKGTLKVVPILKQAMAYMLLRPLLSSDDFGKDLFCGAYIAKQHVIDEKWYKALLEALIPIPDVEPGDTVWWHPDLIHAVEGEHNGTHESSVFYIPAAPLCEKNAEYLPKQKIAFESGESPPDFPKQNREKTYDYQRAKREHLSEEGARQMGYDFWPDDAEPGRQALLEKCKLKINL